MDFFAHEERAKRQTAWLIFYFVLALGAIVVAVYGACASLVVMGDGKVPHLNRDFFELGLFIKVSTITLLLIGAGSFYKYLMLGSGGAEIAQSLGGRLIATSTVQPDEKRLLDVVQEMAIASGTPVPDVYLLDSETGINAFAAGFTAGEAVIGVTHGVVEKLSRDELQGVIAHEFSHILNGDMRLNLRLIAALHGILLLSITGYAMTRIVTDPFGSFSLSTRRGRSRDGGGDNSPVVLILLLGIALMIIGWIGAFFSRIIKAAISRQREFLADAFAVQFTRNPGGLAGALEKIAGRLGAVIAHPNAEQASHLFFGDALAWTFAIFATHPPIEERIARILAIPVEEVPVRSGITFAEPSDVGGVAALSGGVAVDGRLASDRVPPKRMRADARAIRATAGAPSHEHMAEASALLAELPGALREAVSEPFGARAAVIALLLDADMSIRERQLDAVNRALDPTTYQMLEWLIPVADTIAPRLRLVAVSLAMPSLRALSKDQFAAFQRAIEDVVTADGKLTLFEYAVQRMIRRHVELALDGNRSSRPAAIAPGSVAEDARLVLSAVAHMSDTDPVAVERNYRAAATAFGPVGSLRPLVDCSFDALDAALERLGSSGGMTKEKFLDAAVASATADGFITVEEAEIVRAIADTLDCPIPPILPSLASGAA